MSEPVKTHPFLRPLLWLRHGWQPLLFGISLATLLGLVAVWYTTRHDQRDTVRWVGRQLGYEIDVESVTLPGRERLVVRNLRVGDFARLERLELSWSLAGLYNRSVDQLWVYGLEVKLGKMQEALAKHKGSGMSVKPPKLFSFTLKTLVIGQSRLILDNLGAGIPPLPVSVGDVTPLVFRDLKLGGSEEDPASREIQIAELENVILYSPYDATAPVLSFEKIRVGFSWSGIQQNQLDQLIIEQPTIYIGPDLFWFSDRMKEAAAKESAEQAPSVPWTISNFQIIQGGLVLTSDGSASLKLPLTFEAQQSGLVLADFGNMQLAQVRFTIPPINLPYPEYNLTIRGMSGDLYFSLPLEERGTKDLSNITPTLKIEAAVWKGLEVRDIRVSVTFDRKGIYGSIFGQAYAGSIEGGFNVLLDNAMSWKAWASTTRVELDPVTNLLSPEHFVMKGQVDSSFEVAGRSKAVDRFTGKVELNRPGRMTITAVDRVLADLPAEWNALKKELSRVSLEAFRNYDYSTGRAEIAYEPPRSEFRLDLDGAQGKRNFNLRWEDRGLLAQKAPAPSPPDKSAETPKTQP